MKVNTCHLFAIIISVFIGFFQFLGLGLGVRKLLSRFPIQFSSLLWLGIAVASIFTVVCSFFTCLNLGAEIGLIILSLIGILFSRKELTYLFSFKKNIFTQPYFIIFLLFIFLLSSFAPYILDHFGYYVPTINVLDDAGLQTGIVNLNLVLGQNSFWHILEAGINQTTDIYLRLNAFVLIVYLIYTFERKQFYLLVFIPFFLLYIQSPSPDLAIYLLSIYIINEWYFNPTKNPDFLLFMACWAYCIKPTSFWLVLFIGLQWLPIFIKSRGENTLRQGIPFLLLSLFILGLGAMKNFLSSSNIFFPIQDFYISTQWKPNEMIINQSAELAKIIGYNFQYSQEDLQHFSFLDTIINWFKLPGFKGFIHIFGGLILVAFSYYIFKYKKQKYYVLWFLLVLKISLVFYFTAQYRFMWDAILVMILVIFAQFPLFKYYNYISLFACLFVLFFFANPQKLQETVPSFQLGKMMEGFEWKQLYKPIIYEVEYTSQNKVGNLEFNVPKQYPYTFTTPFPAISQIDLEYYYSLGIFPQWKGNILEMKTLNSGEKIELEKIILNNKQ